MISKPQALALHVKYQPGTEGTDDPRLIDSVTGAPIPDQFTFTIGGIGGTAKVAGFFLSSMLVRAAEGNPGNNNDRAHLRFLDAPVLVFDITVLDPLTSQQLTLDGIFGMNFLVATAMVIEGFPFPEITNLTEGAYNWVVFDEPAGRLGLRCKDTMLGDFNYDGSIDIADLGIVGTHWQQSGMDWSRGDFTGDGMVDIADLGIIGTYWQQHSPSFAQSLGDLAAQLDNGLPCSIPEPLSLTLCGLATIVLLLRPRR
jgi:hypothetical protein